MYNVAANGDVAHFGRLLIKKSKTRAVKLGHRGQTPYGASMNVALYFECARVTRSLKNVSQREPRICV